ncbi:calpain-7-like isoform X1 [Pocillopora damicornis]|uniref:calpain-7-like isoform X1 n=1 Tax=Pocillopora damicornis TaxID=46731 RepID=UPI000F54FEDB|nr:calpain-7-like isoform X1 [Pocillopora damicornis]
MVDVTELCEDGYRLAIQAVDLDKMGSGGAAAFFYIEAAEALIKALSYDPSLEVRDKASQYVRRAEELRALEEGSSHAPTSFKTSQQNGVERAEFLLKQALHEDERGRQIDALPLYTDAADLCIKTSSSLPDSDNLKKKLHGLAKQAIERAEAIKATLSTKPESAGSDSTTITRGVKDLSLMSSGESTPGTSTGDKRPHLTVKELEVLKRTSYINGKLFPPWLDIDLKERFAYPDCYSDKDGQLALSQKQKARFTKWLRPTELCENPEMIYAISSFSIKQTIVSDCSFLASLAISAAYERNFKKTLITSIIYPQNRAGKPVINPSGKYMIKLRINGVSRKVIIDDTLPVGRDGELLCSYSNNRNEMWVSLIEKAYLKVMGGYDFPGSNSSIDLHALTGWIPERMSIKRNNPTFNESMHFDRLLNGVRSGDCLVTVATGPMSESEADRAGLVPTHAYALLDIRKVKGHRLLQLKNPWSHLRWKGKFSEMDSTSWTPELQRALNYDRKSAIQIDNGVFWISWECVMQFFDVIYMNWNPKLFKYRFSLHSTWTSAEGPKKDVYNIGDNPQYKLELLSSDRDTVVWILLTRHITQKDDFAENKEFITVHVYKSDGGRVFYPDNPLLEGTKINSPFYLAKLNAPKGTNRFTLVVSQYEKTNTIHYTLKVFSSTEFRLSPVPVPYTVEKQVTGEWRGKLAGGCPNFSSHSNNPVYRLQIKANSPSETAEVLLKLRGPKQFSVGAIFRSVELASDGRPIYEAYSETYRPGFYVQQLTRVPTGTYDVIPSTFHPGQEGPFILTISASCKMALGKK